MYELKVLIVDDDKIDRESIKRCLSGFGEEIRFFETESGKSALEMIGNEFFNCIFLDYLLPDLDGLSVLKKACEKDPKLPPAPIIMLTGHGNESVVIEAIKSGAQDYLSKDNISPDTLRIVMTKAIQMYDLRKQHKQAQEQLFQSQKLDAVGQLTGGVAHDFNNLLTIILGNARIIHKSLPSSESENKRRIETIEGTARRGAELVRRLMIFSRQRPFDSKIENVNDSIEQLTALLKHTLGETVRVKTILFPELWPVKIDVGQMENVLVNLAVNARDAMGGGGMLTIETQNVYLEDHYREKYPDIKPGPYVMIAISDTGTGIPQHIIEHIFEPFFTTKEVGKGTGLGLSMAYGFARESGGHLHVYSELGKGTVFRLYLPQARETENRQGTENDSAIVENGDGETVLVVDDDERLRHMTTIMLQRLNYKVIEAVSGEEALALIQKGQENLALMITDISMHGGMSGVELVERIQRLRPEIAILFMTGFTESTLSTYSLIKDYEIIGKPFRKDVLARKLRVVLNQSSYNQKELRHASS
jgi:signal transduction histidine kinase